MILPSQAGKIATMDTKSAQIVEAKADGTGSAVIATLGVIDSDLDVTEPGFFGKQTTIMLPTHDWSHVPIGKGQVHEEGDLAVVDYKMHMEIPAARDWAVAISEDFKNPPALQQYSYGYTVQPGGSREGEFNGRHVRFLQPKDDGSPGGRVHEFSPVVLGAGEGTRTLSAKATLLDQLQSTVEQAKSAIARATEVAALREKDGRSLGTESQTQLESLSTTLLDLKSAIDTMIRLSDPGVDSDEVASLYAAFIRTENQLGRTYA